MIKKFPEVIMRDLFRKTCAAVLVLCALVCIIPYQVLAAGKTGWRQVGKAWDGLYDWRYYTTSTTYVTGWKKIGGKWYYFGSDGIMFRQHINYETYVSVEVIEGKKYAFNTSGQMLSSKWEGMPGGDTYFTSDGSMVDQGWNKISGKWYYFVKDNFGNIIKLCKDNCSRLYGKCNMFTYYYSDTFEYKGRAFRQNGDACEGWVQGVSNGYSDNKTHWYYFLQKGEAVTGWKKIGGTWYYFVPTQTSTSGLWFDRCEMVYDCRISIGGKTYIFGKGGQMLTGWQKANGVWYYLSAGGEAVTGWKKISKKWYWFDITGSMAAGRTVRIDGKDYKFNSSGVCTNP